MKRELVRLGDTEEITPEMGKEIGKVKEKL